MAQVKARGTIPADGSVSESVAADSGFVDTIVTDSSVVDTLVAGEYPSVAIMESPVRSVEGPSERGTDFGMSWIYLLLTLLFTIGALRVKNSPRHFHAIWSDLFETRLRSNAFDDTVDETMLLVILNGLWAASAGVLLWAFIGITVGDNPAWSMSVMLPQPVGIAVCMVACAIYVAGITAAYWVVGNVFTDSRRAVLWIKGAAASTAIGGVLILPPAFLVLCYPAWTPTLLIIAASVFVLCKILFICKGFRIFFDHLSSWLLFLYYLCSLEIVPLILVYIGTVVLCSMLP